MLPKPASTCIPALLFFGALGACAPASESATEPSPGTPGTPAASADTAYLRPPAPIAAWAQEITDSADRTPEDRNTDARRHPAEFLTFLGVTKGMRVADLGAGGGYTTELLTRAVGPQGQVFGQNNKLSLERYVQTSWPARLGRKINSEVVRLDLEYDTPLPADVVGLDIVTIVFSYHDMVGQGSSVSAFNTAVFNAVAPEGIFVIADHAATPGSGVAAAKKQHRIDEALVVEQVQAAGFELVESANFLRSPSDDGSYAAGAGKDRFVLKFRRPKAEG